jgi:hypothetical protein
VTDPSFSRRCSAPLPPKPRRLPSPRPNTSGPGSLAQAITSANATVAGDEIEFSVLSLGVISIPAPFAAIVHPLLIDGYSQGSAKPNDADFGTSADIKVEFDRASLTQGQPVLQVDGFAVIITGLAIKNLGEKVYGIRVSPGAELTQIEGNFIGTTAVGSDASEGIGIRNDGMCTIIGGPLHLFQRNLISGTDAAGIEDRGVGTTVANNLIGTDESGHDSLLTGRESS